jgi:hypothetical protein
MKRTVGGGESFNGHYLAPRGLAHFPAARLLGLTVNQHDARPAYADSTTVFSSREIEILAQEFEKGFCQDRLV